MAQGAMGQGQGFIVCLLALILITKLHKRKGLKKQFSLQALALSYEVEAERGLDSRLRGDKQQS